MSQQLISRSADLKRLRDEGYDLEIKNAFLLVRDVPYVNTSKNVMRGVLVSSLMLSGDVTVRPDNHVAYFIGEQPCSDDGTEIEKIKAGSDRRELAPGLVIDRTFSARPKPNDFADYYEKVTSYVGILSSYAQIIDPKATAKTFPAIPQAAEDDSVFNYVDTASSRAEIDVVTAKLAAGAVAIVGLGGTGSYVLDLVAKTPVRRIHLYDNDTFSQHNAFRSPGAPSIDELRARPRKSTYLKAVYSKMHRGIVDHAAYLTAENVDQLKDVDFVFLCLDKGSAKRLIVEKLEAFGRPFVDVGMGVTLEANALGGILRITTSVPQQRELARAKIPFSDGDGRNEYDKNIQVADLNALNATLAVIKWKKIVGFYHDLDREHHSTYTIDGNMLTNEDRLT